MKYGGSLRLGQIRLSSRSLGQMLEKSCVHSRGHSFHETLSEYRCTWHLGHLSPKKQTTKFSSADFRKMLSPKLYLIENSKTRGQTV